MSTRTILSPVLAVIFGLATLSAYAASSQQALAPGDTLRVTCSTTMTGSVTSGYADLACAPLPTPTPTAAPVPTATPSPEFTWITPRVTSLDHSTGYDPFSDPGGYAFCPPPGYSQYAAQDDDDTWFKVYLNDGPLRIRGWRGASLAYSSSGASEMHWVFSVSQDGVSYTQVHDRFEPWPFLPNYVVTPFSQTFPEVTARYLRFDANFFWSFVTLRNVELLTSSSTPRGC